MRRAWMAAGATLVGAGAARATNFIVVVSDDLGVDKFERGLHAPEVAEARSLPITPTLDALARSGITFSRAWANPTCSPTRATFHTGDFAFHHGVGETVSEGGTVPELSTSLPTVAEELHDAGWATAAFGKWHLGYTGVGGTTSWTPVARCPLTTTVADEQNPLLHGYDLYHGEILQTFDGYTSWWLGRSPGDGTTQVCFASQFADESDFDAALAWISDRWDAAAGSMSPYFVYVATKTAHTDGQHNPEGYDEDDVPADCDLVDPCVRDGAEDSCGDADGDGTDDEQVLLGQAMVQCLDANIDAFLSGIADLGPGALDDTWIVYFGDNGTNPVILEPPFTEAETRGKGTMAESGVRVPLIVAEAESWVEARDGGVPEGREVTFPGREVALDVGIVDLYDTILELAGVTPAGTTDGESLVACLGSLADDCGLTPSRPMWTESFRYDTTGALGSGAGALKLGDWKLRFEYDTAARCLGPELYDLAADPQERDDRYDTAAGDTVLSLKTAVATVGATWLPRSSRGQPVWCK